MTYSVRLVCSVIFGLRCLKVGSKNSKIAWLELFFFILPYLSSIYEKASCIAIFGTERPHSLGSCQSDKSK